MSRIGKKPVPVPKGVTVTVDGLTVKVKGPRGELSPVVHRDMRVAVDGATVTVARPSDEPMHRALHGLTRTLVANMVQGVTAGFRKQLEIVGVGYKAETRPYGLQLTLGFSHPVEFRAPVGIKLTAPRADVDRRGRSQQGNSRASCRGVAAATPARALQGQGSRYLDQRVRRSWSGGSQSIQAIQAIQAIQVAEVGRDPEWRGSFDRPVFRRHGPRACPETLAGSQEITGTTTPAPGRVSLARHVYAQISGRRLAPDVDDGIQHIVARRQEDGEVRGSREEDRSQSQGGRDYPCRLRPCRVQIPRAGKGSGGRRPRGRCSSFRG